MTSLFLSSLLSSRSSSLNATRLEQNLVMADSLNEKSLLKKSDLFLKLSRNNWHGAFLPNIKSESTENDKNIFLT